MLLPPSRRRSSSIRRLVLACALALCPAANTSAQQFTPLSAAGVTVNGDPALGAVPNDLSSNGAVVVGFVFTTEEGGGRRGFRWQNGFLELLDRCNEALRVSANGRIIVGYCSNPDGDPLYWDDGAFVEPAFGAPNSQFGITMTAVSGDGRVLYGTEPIDFVDNRGQRETRSRAVVVDEFGATAIGALPGDKQSTVLAASFDGSVALIESRYQNFHPEEELDVYSAARWQGGALQDLGPIGAEPDVFSADVSSDGTTLVGFAGVDNLIPWRWTEATGMVSLGFPEGGDVAIADATNGDGTMIVGAWSGPGIEERRAAIWTPTDGNMDLADYLVDKVGIDLQGWTLLEATTISDDGSAIGGMGFAPGSDIPGGWLVTLAPGLDVTLQAFGADGEELDGDLSIDQTLDVRLTIANRTGKDLDDFTFTNDELLVIDGQSTGGSVIVEGPIPNLDAGSLTLPAGDTIEVEYRVTTTERGLVGIHSEITGTDPEDTSHDDAHSLKLDIEDGQLITEELEKFLLLQIVNQAMEEAYRQYYEGLREAAGKYFDRLQETLTPKQFKKWFGKADEFKLGNFEHMQSVLRGEPPELVDAAFPDKKYKGYTRDELGQAMEDAMFEEIGKSAEKWVDDWVNVAKGTQKVAKATYREALLASFYAFGTATPEERLEFTAKMVDIAETNDATANSIYDTAKQEIPRWKENGVYFGQALLDSGDQVVTALPEIKRRVLEEISPPPMELLETDPLRWHQENGKVLAKPITTVMPIVFDAIFGTGAAKVGTVTKNVVMRGAGGSVVRGGQAMGVVDDTGKLVKGSKTGIRRSSSDAPHGVRQADAPRNSEEFLDDLQGATVVQASDAGKVYELPNRGGVPEPTLDAKAELMTELGSDYKKATGMDIEYALVLKPSSALRKKGGVAKLELTGQKTGKPAMIDAGMPGAALAEANVWRNPVHPKKRKGWRSLSKARKQAAVDEWKKANDRWDEYHGLNGKKPDAKTKKLKKCIGKECRVALDDKPGEDGLRRFVRAEFEEKTVTQGSAKAKLIRVKKYVVEVVDGDGRLVNTKTIVDSKKAIPQTPDADALALAKVVGKDADGRPILERLTRAEREFAQPRYMDKVQKFRRAGKLPDAAEHGMTWMIDDASAQASGVLFPKYGAPFLPSKVGVAYLSRIAKFVKPEGKTEAEMLVTMLKLVQKEGGFGQRAVVVTADTRYFGRLNISQW